MRGLPATFPRILGSHKLRRSGLLGIRHTHHAWLRDFRYHRIR